MHAPSMSDEDAADVKAMAGKYNLGGFIEAGEPGLVVIEGLEFNCDIFVDNIDRQKKDFRSVGKGSERSGRAFPMELTKLEGDNAMSDFIKAAETVGLKEKLDS